MRSILLLALMTAILAPSALASATVGDDTVIEILGYDPARGLVLYTECSTPREPSPEVDAAEGAPLPLHDGCSLVHLDVASGAAEERSFTYSPERERQLRDELAALVPLPELPLARVRLSRRVQARYQRYHPWHDAELPWLSLDVRARAGSHTGRRSVEAFQRAQVRLRSAHRVPNQDVTLVVFAYRGSAFEGGYDVDEVLVLRGPSSAAQRFERGTIHLSTSAQGLGVRTGEQTVTLPYTDEAGCRARVAEVVAASAPRSIGRAPFTAELRAGRLTSRHGVLFDPAPFLCRPPDAPQPTDSRSISVELLSIYGSFVTIRARRSEAAAGGPPYHAERWETFDLRDGRSTDVARLIVERLVPEQAVVAALRADPWVVAHGGLGAEHRTFDQVRAALEPLGARGLGAFAVAGVDPERGVNLRIAFHAPGEDAPHLTAVRALGVWLPVRVPGGRADSAVFLP